MNIETNNIAKCEKANMGLEHVYDPEIGLNVVDLGLIYALNFLETENKTVCTMTLTTEFCPMGESIVDNVRQSLQTSFPNDEVEVNVTFEPHWNQARISENGRKFLNR